MYLWNGKNIYFIGFMGTGKSRVGKEIAYFLGWPFLDTDDLIEEKAGQSISQIFSEQGEQAFRDLESEIVSEVAQKKEQVVALGGGAILRPENWDLLTQSGVTIALHADVDTLFQRIHKRSHRPLMSSYTNEELLQRISSLLEQRKSFYQKADFSFNSTQDVPPKVLAKQIFKTLCEEL